MVMQETRADDRVLAQVYVELDGAEVRANLHEDLIQFDVDSSMHLPDMLLMQLHNPDLRWSEGAFAFTIGKKLKVGFGSRDNNETIFDGEITGIEVESGVEHDTLVTLTAYDKGHRLHRGTKTRAFEKQKDSDIAKKIAGENGLTPDVQPTAIVYDWLIQHNQTDWEFLLERARRNGYTVFVNTGKLIFRAMDTSISSALGGAAEVPLKYGEELLSFRARMTTGGQASEAQVHGWDYAQKKEVLGKSSTVARLWSTGEPKTGAQLAETFGKATMNVHAADVLKADSAKVVATAAFNDIGNAFAEVEGRAIGNPKLNIGRKVKMDGVGAKFGGSYVITSAHHSYSRPGYFVEFKATGHRATDVFSLLTPPPAPAVRLLHGIVTNNKDPMELGRVKVKFPALDAQMESHWCRIAALGAGPQRGAYFLPEVNDEVLVMGENMDDLYILGGLWNGKDKPVDSNSNVLKGGAVIKRIIRSRTGHVISIDDSADGGNISIIDSKGKNKVIIDTKNGSLELVAERDIKISAGQNLIIESKMGATSFDAGTDFKVQSKTSAKVETNGQLTLGSQGPASLKSSSMTEVKGSMVNIGP